MNVIPSTVMIPSASTSATPRSWTSRFFSRNRIGLPRGIPHDDFVLELVRLDTLFGVDIHAKVDRDLAEARARDRRRVVEGLVEREVVRPLGASGARGPRDAVEGKAIRRDRPRAPGDRAAARLAVA